MKTVILDIETDIDDKERTIHLCVTKCIETKEVKTWTQEKREQLATYLRDCDKIVGHNIICFDAFQLNKLWNTKIRKTVLFDTLVASRLLNPSLEGGHSLKAWGERISKDNGKIDYPERWEEAKGRKQYYFGECFVLPIMPLLEEYCIQDVELTHKLYDHLKNELESYGFSEHSISIEHEVQMIIAQQERNGFYLNLPYTVTLLSEINAKMQAVENKMQERFPPVIHERYSEKTGKRLADRIEVFNPGSRKQIAERLIGLGWKPDKKTEKGAIIVDEAVLSGIDIPEAKIFLEYMMLQKRAAQLNSWLEAADHDTSRVYGKVITNGAVTGRMTHHSPNMAQVPNAGSEYGVECRSCWGIPKGYKQVGADASGLELRMLAHYMNDPEYTNEVVNGDIHTKNQTAAGLPTRNNAKTFIYAFLYGAGAAKIGSIVGGGAREGQKLIDSFLKATPALSRLKDKVARLAEKGHIRGLDGRRVWVRSEHAALNTLLQSAGAIVMKQALIILDKKIKKDKLDAKFIANVHDEWQLEVKEGHEEAVGKAAVQSIREAGEFFNMRCPLDGEYKIGGNWAECH